MKRGVKIALISGAVLTVVAPVIGLLGTVSGMIKSFSTLGSSGVANPGAEERCFVVLIGFLATWWVGMIAG